MLCRLTPANVLPGGLVPPSTDWFVRASSAYPLGAVKFNPAKRNGLTQTFPHQSYNEAGHDEVLWRTGVPCLDTPTRILGRRDFTIEPFEAHKRLCWHVRRALGWLEAASRGELIVAGEPFELPQYPVDHKLPFSVAFSEAPESYETWKETKEMVGIAEFYVLNRLLNLHVVKSFGTLDGRKLLMPAWGRSITHSAGAVTRGFWLRLETLPVVEPWQAPVTWGELRGVCREQGINIDEHLRAALAAAKVKDEIGRVALIGFPIPARMGETPERMHWQGLRLPDLAASNAPVRGFRPHKKWALQHNRDRVLRDGASIKWLESENWFPDQLTTRGGLPLTMISKKILLLGTGALGAPIAELLVRGGTYRILVVDEDHFEAGNLVRHTLGVSDLNEYKAEAVAKRLNDMSPHARIEWINSEFPPKSASDKRRVAECDIVIDCTGSDEVLYELSAFDWSEDALFFSASLSLGAKRLFCFAARGNRFPAETFRQKISPWLAKDVEAHARQELPREGIGCWHPVFPARADDVWMMASLATKQLERVAASPLPKPELTVFEQHMDEDGLFSGVRRVAVEVCDEESRVLVGG